ncbi:uncharacterized protein LOC128016282 isoform X2 [Carassius gibelio]|uniref:uncharacterized protein LOC128016282 isoform X2 n=1 Tax=Carassius gibelio TaxID=101364 RepID=UPI00227912C3|nr:uncharacterized protein LOC128016282 isoform X2 [Carassius gibelio]
MAKERAQFFSQAEHELLMEGYAEFKSLIKTRGNTSMSAKARREGWQKVADKLNAVRPTTGPTRTWEQVKVKYKNILQNANKKKAEKNQTPQYTPAEELALGLNENRTTVEGIPGGSSSSDPKTETSISNTFISVLHKTPTLLPVPVQVVAEAYADSEETISEDCPLEEEPESTPRERLAEESAQRTNTEGDIHSLYKRHLQQKMEYFELKKCKLRGEIELDNLKKRKIALEIELLQKDLQSKR